MPSDTPFQLLEIDLISAEDLSTISKSMRTFAVAWLHPERKLSTRVDSEGQANPTWNEKFVFRVDDEFLNEETSNIMIEIYSSSWRRDMLIGSVSVLMSNLLPQRSKSSRDKKPKMRFMSLQIRRPSGRAQGILNIGVTLLHSTMRSMPIDSELSTSAVDYWDLMDGKTKKSSNLPSKNEKICKTTQLQRSRSERAESDIGKPSASVVTASMHHGSELGGGRTKLVNANGSLCSDVGPSPSVVAAAIAKGLYPTPEDAGSSILEDWTEQDSTTEGLKTKIERWRTELPPVYDHDINRLRESARRKKVNTKGRGKGGGLFSCMGTAYGCEFSITCGGGKHKKKNRSGKPPISPSEVTYDPSYV